MKLRVLGKYGRFPLADAGTSSFLVYTDKEKFLLDMGCSSLSKLLKYSDITDISAIILSHLHGDHIADFKAFTYMANIYKMEGKLDHNIIVYLPKTPEHIYNEINSANGLEFRIITDGLINKIGDTTLSFLAMKHPVETYGVRIENNKKVLSYTADTLLCDRLKTLINNADAVIGDACILDINHKTASPHLSVKELAAISKQCKVKKLILAHLPDYGTDKILLEAKNELDNSVLAEEGIETLI